MFAFLTRLGRLVVGIPVIALAASLLGFGSIAAIPLVSTLTGSTASTSSLTLDSSDPSFGAHIAFTASYSSMKWVPEESITCTSNGQQMYLDVQTYSGGSPWTSSWTLWSQTWANSGGGPASCTAKLFYYTWRGHTETGVVYLASQAFDAT